MTKAMENHQRQRSFIFRFSSRSFVVTVDQKMTSSLDTLTSSDVRELLSDKYVLVLGDTVIRSLYKDVIKFFNSDQFLNEEDLRLKNEKRFYGDRLIRGNIEKCLTNGDGHQEIREYTNGGRVRIRYYFVTRCYSSYMKRTIFNDIENQTIKPDIVIMNSCLFDLTRYGIDAMANYQKNIDHLFECFRQILPNAVLIWLSALPVSNAARSGVIIPTAEYLRPILPGIIRDANYHCSQLCEQHNILYLDLHRTFSHMVHLRRSDGIHWNPIATRIMTESALHYMRAFYKGVRSFHCRSLRQELEVKITAYKQRWNKGSTSKDYLRTEMLDEKSTRTKRQRETDEIDINEKENKRQAKIKPVEPSVLVARKPLFIQNRTTEPVIRTPISSFNHEYADMMFDNEYEGLSLAYFNSTDNVKYEAEESQAMPIIAAISENVVPSPPPSKPSNGPDFILLSSDDEYDEKPAAVLPIYLLIRQ